MNKQTERKKKKPRPLRPVVWGDITDGFDLIQMGDPNTGWIPSQSHMSELARLLKSMKYSNSFIVTHYAVKVEKWDRKYIFKMGDPNTGWIISTEEADAFAKAVGPHCQEPILVHHYGVSMTEVEGLNE